MLSFRKATLADAKAVSILVNSVYRGDSSRAGWTTEADLLGGQRIDAERASELIAAAQNALLVSDSSDSLSACVLLEKKSDKICYLGMLAVDASKQSRGLGRNLIAYAEEYAVKEFGTQTMEMTVIGQRQELIEYYLRRGYHLTGEKRPFPMNDPRFGTPLRNDLYFEVLVKNLQQPRGSASRPLRKKN